MEGVVVLEQAQHAGLKVWSEGDELVIQGPKSTECLALAARPRNTVGECLGV